MADQFQQMGDQASNAIDETARKTLRQSENFSQTGLAFSESVQDINAGMDELGAG
jgi:hypothetical protein